MGRGSQQAAKADFIHPPPPLERGPVLGPLALGIPWTSRASQGSWIF